MSKTSKNELAEIAADLKQRRFLRAAKFFRTLQDTEPSEVGEVAQLIVVSRRQAFYLAKVHRVFSELGVSSERLEAIGWTKLKILARRINASNCELLLDMAETCTARQIKFFVRDKLPVPGERCVTLYFTPNQHAVFETAVLAHGGAKSGKGLMGKEAALIKALEKSLQV